VRCASARQANIRHAKRERKRRFIDTKLAEFTKQVLPSLFKRDEGRTLGKGAVERPTS